MSQKRTILVADDESRMRRLLEASLVERGYSVLTAADGEEAIGMLDDRIDAVLTDLKMPRKDGFDVLRKAKEVRSELPVIMMTAFGTIDSAVDAMREGAFDYITKPFNLDEVEILIDRALSTEALLREHRYLRDSDRQSLEDMIGPSESMQRLFASIRRVAVTDSSVLVTGETGTGKELVARAIHALSPRRDHLFVDVNCAAIPVDLLESQLFGHTKGAFTGATDAREGKFELADRGTIFLDEIGDMSSPLQSKILRVLEEGVIERIGSNTPMRIDTRVISATNRDLEKAMRDGGFRQDLYYRLNVIRLQIPPLRERRSDIAPLAERFLADSAVAVGRSPLALEENAAFLLEAYPWPGNVRELRNVCERLAVLCDRDRVSVEMLGHLLDLPSGGGSLAATAAEDLNLSEAVSRIEAETVRQALSRTDGNKAEAARVLGISERTLWYKLKKYKI